MNIIRKLLYWRRRHTVKGIYGDTIHDTSHEEVWIGRSRGNKIYAHIHRPVTLGRYPGVIFVPGGISTGTDYDGNAEVTAADVAALGFTVLHYDPSGRGKTGGQEDHWGPRHQKELADVVMWFSQLLSVDRNNIGILSFSIGIAIAAGALARFSLPVRYLFDWEGPSNRFNITRNDTHKPLRGFPTSDEPFWSVREPRRFMAGVPCGYFRYQSEDDHMQGLFKGHAVELLNLATHGKTAWTRCNDNPVNTEFDKDNTGTYHWVSSRLNQRARILRSLLDIQALLTMVHHRGAPS
jgi:hypothetical protein